MNRNVAVGSIKPAAGQTQQSCPQRAETSYAENQGRSVVYGVDLEILDDEGNPVALMRDAGDLVTKGLRGSLILSARTRQRDVEQKDGCSTRATWNDGTLTGYVTIRDRFQGYHQAGGEWISSVELENIAIAHPQDRRRCASSERAREMGRTPILIAVKGRRPGTRASGGCLVDF